jgi:glucose-6-phosphate 1-dehydrogenase
VANVRITFKEDIGVEGRAGYFDSYGIIRDIMQNHLLQLLTLVAMEAPASLDAEDVRDEKVKVLKQIRPATLDDCVVGQYDGYQDDPQIQAINAQRGRKSVCPTFATVILYLDNERWTGVPFILKAAKAVEQRCTLIRLQFKKSPPNSLFGAQPQNELIMRVQPDEAIYYKVLAKTPGLCSKSHEVRRTVLDMDLKKSFEVARFPEAYEKLIHDVIEGERHNFVRGDEVEQGWRIFDPLLRDLEAGDRPVPDVYAQGSRGPPAYHELIDRAGFRRYTSTGHPGRSVHDFQ